MSSLQLLLRLLAPSVSGASISGEFTAYGWHNKPRRATPLLSADSSIPAIGDGLQNEQAWKDALVLYKANPKVPPAAQQSSEERQMQRSMAPLRSPD